MAFDKWTKEKAHNPQKCCDCKGEIKKGEEYMNHCWREEDGHKGRGYWEGNKYCLACYQKKEQKWEANREAAAKRTEQEIGEIRKRKKQKIKEKFEVLSNECFSSLLNLGLKAHVPENLTEEDYKEIKSLQKRLERASKETELSDPLIKQEINSLQTQFQELEAQFPKRTKDKKVLDCRHKNIFWKLNERAYCLDCGEDEDNKQFLRELKWFHKKNLDNWVRKNNLNSKESLNIIDKLLVNSFVTQDELNKTYQQIIHELNQLAKDKGINDLLEENNNNNPNNKQREREQLQQAITYLANKPNKTPQEEQDLKAKQAELANLESANSEPAKGKNNWLKPALIIGTITIIAIVLIYLIAKPKKKKP